MKEPRKPGRKQKKPVEPESLEQRVHRHISDITSEITDDDIRSVKTELEVRATGNEATQPETGKEESENVQKKKITPWDELSSGYE